MDKNTDYTVFELFDMLKADESWEKDPERRVAVADDLYEQLMW